MLPHIKSADPYRDLQANPYLFNQVFSRHKDFEVQLIGQMEEFKVLIFEKKFNGTAEKSFVFCIDEKVNVGLLKKLIKVYRQFVVSLSNRNFRDVEPIIIATSFENEVISLIETYNMNYNKRKPFRVFTYSM
jgi:hypothetical protein